MCAAWQGRVQRGAAAKPSSAWKSSRARVQRGAAATPSAAFIAEFTPKQLPRRVQHGAAARRVQRGSAAWSSSKAEFNAEQQISRVQRGAAATPTRSAAWSSSNAEFEWGSSKAEYSEASSAWSSSKAEFSTERQQRRVQCGASQREMARRVQREEMPTGSDAEDAEYGKKMPSEVRRCRARRYQVR
jgi:hypothetical protein